MKLIFSLFLTLLFTIDLSATLAVNYQMDECNWDGSGNKVQDSSLNKYDIKAYNNANTESNITSNGLLCRVGKFDGSGSKIYGNFDFEFENSVSILVWINTSNTQNPYSRILEFSSHNGDYRYSTALAYDSSGKIIRGWTTNSSAVRSKEVQYNLSSNGFHDDKWHFLAYVYDGSSAKLYIDANLVDEVSTNIVKIERPNKIAVGGYGLSDSYSFQGFIDEAKVFDTALSADEISSIFENEKNGKNYDGTRRDCKCYVAIADYHLDECLWSGFDNEVKDSSINQFDGTAYGTTTIENGGFLCKSGDFTLIGVDDYVSINHKAMDGLKDFSISVWIKTSQTSTMSIISGANSSKSDEMKMYFYKPTKFRAVIHNTYLKFNRVKDVGDNIWHHIVWTRKSSNGENCIVIDGEIDNKICKTSSLLGGEISIDEGGLIVAQDQSSVGGGFDPNLSFDGYMDELKIFNKILSDDQIEAIFLYETNNKNYDGSQRVCKCCIDANITDNLTPLEFEGANITLHDTYINPSWTHVDFNKSFSSIPAVFVVSSSRGDHPATVRIKNVTKTGFDAIMSEPQGEDGPHYDQDISFLAINNGIHKIGNTYFEVGIIETKKYHQASLGNDDVNDWEKVNTIFKSCKPVVVANIQTVNNEIGLDSGNNEVIRSIPFLTTALDVNSSGVFLSLERSETHEGNLNNDEIIAYMIAPANIQDSVVDDYGKNILFETIRKEDYFVGWDDTCKSVNFVNNYSKIPLIAANKNSKNEQDGGWFRRCLLDNTKIGLIIDEDGSRYSKVEYNYDSSYQDKERHHKEESGGIIVFSDNIVIREEEQINQNFKFDAWDTFRNINDKNISTKIVNKEFNLTIASLNENGSDFEEFNGTVCTTIGDTTRRLIFNEQNSSTVTFKIDRAIRDARVHLSWKKNVIENCPLFTEDNSTDSSDNFAIRPDSFEIDTNTSLYYAGLPFKIELNATDFEGKNVNDYNETEGISFILDKNDSNISCVSGELYIPLNLKFSDGFVLFDSNYSEVGDLNITIKEKLGNEFAKVDLDDTNDESRLIEQKSMKIYFEPYQFAIVNYNFERFPNQQWRYIGNVRDSNITVSFKIQAQNKMGKTTKKFDKNCYSKDVGMIIKTVSSSGDGNVSYYKSVNKISFYGNDKKLDDFDLNETINASDFIDGNSSKIVYALNVYREFNNPKNPLDINITDINTSYFDSNVKNLGFLPNKNGSIYYYGRTKTSDLVTNISPIKHQIEIEVFSSIKDHYVDSFKQNSLNWYKMEDDNISNIYLISPQKSFIFVEGSDISDIVIIPNSNIISDKGEVDFSIKNSLNTINKAFMHIKIPKYLWFSSYKDYNDSNQSDCSMHPCFEYSYKINLDNKSIKSGEFKGTSIGSDYNSSNRSKVGVKVFR